jgi:hypothetical protein
MLSLYILQLLIYLDTCMHMSQSPSCQLRLTTDWNFIANQSMLITSRREDAIVRSSTVALGLSNLRRRLNVTFLMCRRVFCDGLLARNSRLVYDCLRTGDNPCTGILTLQWLEVIEV